VTELGAAIYGLVQGLTEFLPVSSSGHLALYDALAGGAGKDRLALSVLVHVASLGAVLIVFRREVLRLFGADRRLGVYICIATAPAIAAGLLCGDVVENVARDPVAVALFLMATGLMLIGGEAAARRRREASGTEQKMGLWQALALLPGISRSGMTISAGRSLGLSRDASVRFAFLLAVPAIIAAGGYEGLKLLSGRCEAGVGLLPALVAFAVALVSSWIALVVLIRIVRRAGLWVFSPYCFAVGIAALVHFAWR